MSDPRRRLPALTALLGRDDVAAAIETHGHGPVVAALRATLDAERQRLTEASPTPTPVRRGSAGPPPADDGHLGATGTSTAGSDDDGSDWPGSANAVSYATGSGAAAETAIVAPALQGLERERARRLQPVINATGVILHTNLGRAPLSDAAIAAVADAAGATNLETDLATGERGGRGEVVASALARLAGAEDALAVNNGAAALLLVLAVLARGREVVISRGELVEIGGSFRLPEIMAAAGVRLREIGTTNRTHLGDYERAVHTNTGAVLRVHPSNFRTEGFVHRPSDADIAEVAHGIGVPFVHDVGSGLLAEDDVVAPGEPTVPAALAAGADLVVCSADKLLGGPQAGILAGRAALVERCRRDPMTRALRLDKLRIAALEATLASYERDTPTQIPLWAMATVDTQRLRQRAERLAERCGGEVVATDAVLGGGAVPGHTLPSWGVALPGQTDSLARRLRTGEPAVYPRIVGDAVVVDLRSVPEHLDDTLAAAIAAARDDGHRAERRP